MRDHGCPRGPGVTATADQGLHAPAIAAVQRRTVAVLSVGQVFGGIAVAGSVAAGSLIAASVADSEAAAGFAQTAGVLGAAVLALPLARIALGRGRRLALATGYGLGAFGAVIVVVGAVLRNLPLVLIGCFFVGVASASGYQARYAATDLAPGGAPRPGAVLGGLGGDGRCRPRAEPPQRVRRPGHGDGSATAVRPLCRGGRVPDPHCRRAAGLPAARSVPHVHRPSGESRARTSSDRACATASSTCAGARGRCSASRPSRWATS